MAVLPAITAAFALAATVLALRLLVMPLVDPRSSVWRIAFLCFSIFLAWRYMGWRFTETVAPLDWTFDALFSWSFALLEGLTVVSSTIAFVILMRTKERTAEADANLRWWAPTPPRVDVFIATYNEDREVLERTIIGAKASTYPNLRIFVLDDGRRPWLASLCADYAVGYVTRPDNAHAKAGNLNHAVAMRLQAGDAPDFIAVLDADFVPHREFVERAVALFHAPDVGLVQTPQHFFNPDPVQHNLGVTSGYPDEQRHFFDTVEPSRDAWGIAICCGTSSMVRVSALQQIGGVPTESVTEDFLLTLRLSEHGWRTVYLGEPLTEGLAPEGLQEYIVQRGRWCLGMMQVVRNVYNPIGDSGLGLRHRISVLDSLLFWTTMFPFRLAGLLCPLLYWWFGVTVVSATVTDIISYYVPYFIAVTATLNWLSRGMFIPILNDVGQLLAAWPITRAVALGLFTPGPHKFKVTAKGGDRTKIVIQWPLMRPFLIILALTLGGMIVSLYSDFTFNNASTAGDGMTVVLFWTLYNLIVLMVAIAACVERPRPRRPQRQEEEPTTFIAEGRNHAGWIVNLGSGGARISGPSGLAVGSSGCLAVAGVGEIEAEIVAATDDGYRLRFSPTREQTAALVARLHTRTGAPGTTGGNLVAVAKDLARALSR